MTRAELDNPQRALEWMLKKKMIIGGSTKDPETFATMKGYVLSEEMRERLGDNLVKLLAKTVSKKELAHVTVRDAFLAATMAAVLHGARTSLNHEELTRCANIIFALLPITRFEEAGLANLPLRSLVRSKATVEELRRIAMESLA